MPIKISTMNDAEKAAALKKTYEWIDGAAKTDLLAEHPEKLDIYWNTFTSHSERVAARTLAACLTT